MKPFLFLTIYALALSATARAQVAPQHWTISNPHTAIAPGTQSAPDSDPRTFPDSDEAAFQQRAQIILQGLAQNDLGAWRRGYFTGGDPGKYLPGAAMAKLILDPNDAEARRYMNDDRSYKEHYHFAAVNWGRFLPIFGDALTPETQRKLAESAARYSSYLNPTGTENHKTMEWTTANVLPHYLVGAGGLSNQNKATSLAQSKERLRQYVKGLYAAGQGEWDSSTYLMFDVNGLLNIYDFSPDAESRLLAKAGLDWLVAGFALKWRDGIYTAPNQRGFYDEPNRSIAAQTGWLWWGGNAPVTPQQTRGWLFTVHAITSSYRPNAVITALAQKRTLGPFEARNTKPNYWHGLSLTPKPGVYHETVWNGNGYTLGSLWDGFGGQTTRLQLVASSPGGGVAFTGGHPRKSDHTGKLLDEISYGDGNGRYDQSAQFGGAYISMSRIPDDEPLDYSFFSIPDAATSPVRMGKWITMRVGETFLGLYPLAGEAVIGETDLSAAQQSENARLAAKGEAAKFKRAPIVRFPGRPTGFILQTMSARDAYFLLTHQAAFQKVPPQAPVPTVEDLFGEFGDLLEKREMDASRFKSDMEATYRTLDGNGRDVTIRMKYQPDADHAAVWFDKAPVDLKSWPIYGSEYLQCRNSVLTINDGTRGLRVDFSGDLPVYRKWPQVD